MNTNYRTLIIAALAAVASVGLQAQTTGGTTSGGTTTGGTTTGGTTTGSSTTGGSSASDASNGKAKGKDKDDDTPTGGTTTGGTTTGGTTTTQTPAGNAKGKTVDKVKGPNENASQRAKDVHEIIAAFKAQREQYLADRKLLLEKLKTASEADKKIILEQLRADSQARETEERSLGKQIREDLKGVRKGGS